MATTALGDFVRFLQKACALQGTCNLTDHELLERFLFHQDEGAFTFLVRRHGPMILDVGQRVLRDAHEAEDVLQATFLVLARRTRSIEGKRSVGGWLHNVAQRIALRAQAQKAARRTREREAGNMWRPQPVDDPIMQELRSVLDEAIGSLPEKYRAPIVLCYLEGKSHNQAAEELGWPKNTVTNRLARGCELVRRKLERRGITLAVGALATALTEMAAAAPLRVALTINTVKSVSLMATGKAVTGGCISAHVLALAEGTMKGALWTKAKMILVVVGLGLAVGGGGWAGYLGSGETPQPPPVAKAQPPMATDQAENKPGLLVTLVSQRQEYFLGENILVRYRLENTSKLPARYEKGGFYPTLRRNDGFRVSAVLIDDKGRPTDEVVSVIPEPRNFGGPVTNWELAPGGIYEQTLYLPRYLRFEKPGRYRIRIANVVRLDPAKELSAGEITFVLKLPNAQQAQAVYDRTRQLPTEPVAATGEATDIEIADFEALVHPVYLPVLAAAAANKDKTALTGLGKIHTSEATAALVNLTDQAVTRQDLDFALLAYRELKSRLPNPRYFQFEKTDPTAHKQYAVERAFLERVWRPEFAKPLREFASHLARADRTEGLGDLSFILECVGNAEDLSNLMRGYTQSIEATKTLPFETHQYFRPRGSSYGFRFAARALLARGAQVPINPQTYGEAAVYFIALADRPNFRPSDWKDQVVRWLKCDSPYLREFVLDHTPEPFPTSALDLVPGFLAHDYVDLQIAACHVTRKHPRAAYHAPLERILREGKEQYLLNAATAAGPPNGITNDRILEILLGRIGNDDLAGRAMVRMLTMIVTDGEGSSQRQIPEATQTAVVARWTQFIDANRGKLRDGHRFRIGDPEITADLFPPGFQFHYQGKLWPAPAN